MRVRYWAGVTDNDWYQFVATRRCEEVNFWQPSPRPPFTKLPEGTPFLFKLKSPNDHIAGGGYFVRFTALPLVTAWDAFGEANGAASLADFVGLIQRNAASAFAANQEIGCNVLTNVFFLPRSQWIPVDGRMARHVMRGAILSDETEGGRSLWQQVVEASISGVAEKAVADERRFGKPFLAAARLGQGAFRALVTDAYKRRCAITGESTLPVLQAAHIQAYSAFGPHQVSNGLLLRSDFHKLFDIGLVTVEPDYKIRISKKIHEQWYNGKAYYQLHGQQLVSLPDDEVDRPGADYLRWHNEKVFFA